MIWLAKKDEAYQSTSLSKRTKFVGVIGFVAIVFVIICTSTILDKKVMPNLV